MVAKAWGTPHPWLDTRLNRRVVMAFGPRDTEELETMAGIVAASHTYATAD
ncbi:MULTISPECIES: hypothetical protein [Nocardioides]|uniref:Luciferase domain-containing protein n=1 Tax=Nocardioides vastitatis TaxID=2568655 RepID=A0ABW0ZH94_9ACTN|nr:hypothetical protein [Nocardioides sp.]